MNPSIVRIGNQGNDESTDGIEVNVNVQVPIRPEVEKLDAIANIGTEGAYRGIEYLELKNIVFSYIEQFGKADVDDFKEFLRNRNLLTSEDKIERECWKLWVLGCSFTDSGLIHLSYLSTAEIDHVNNAIGKFKNAIFLRQGCKIKSRESEPFPVSYPYVLANLKHSKEGSIVDFSVRCYNGYYRDIDPYTLMRNVDLSKGRMFYLYFFARINYEPNRFLPCDYICIYCEEMGLHFADECILHCSIQLKQRVLEGLCNKCNDGRTCFGLHSKVLRCTRCNENGFETEMCPCSVDIQQRKATDFRKMCVIFSGWNDQMFASLLWDLYEWTKNYPDHPNAKKWAILEKYLDFQMNFPPDLHFVY